LQRLLRQLHAWLKANDVFDFLREPAIEIHEEVDAADLAAINATKIFRHERTRVRNFKERCEFLPQSRFVFERKLFGGRFEEKSNGLNTDISATRFDFDEQFVCRAQETRGAPM